MSHGKIQGFINIGLAIGFAISAGWLGDALKGETLFNDWFRAGISYWYGIAASLIVLLLCAYFLYQRRRSFLPVHQLAQLEAPYPSKAIIICVSTLSIPGCEDEEGSVLRCAGEELKQLKESGDVFFKVRPQHGQPEKTLNLSGNLRTDIHHPLIAKSWNWHQILRAIAPHRDRLELIYLIGSKNSKTPKGQVKPGSHEELQLCKRILEKYRDDIVTTPHRKPLQIETFEYPVEFDSVEALHGALENIIQRMQKTGTKTKDMIIDSTGGLKTTSIAAAMATLRHPDMAFQYVHTDGDKVLSYNVVNARSEIG